MLKVRTLSAFSEESPSLGDSPSVVESPEAAEPAWLHEAASTDGSEDEYSDTPAWLRELKVAYSTENSNPSSDTPPPSMPEDFVTPSDIAKLRQNLGWNTSPFASSAEPATDIPARLAAPDATQSMNLLRRKLRESGPEPGESSPEVAPVIETNSQLNHLADAFKHHRILVAASIFVAMGLLLLGGAGFVGSRISVEPLSTPTLRRQLAFLPPTWTPTVTPTATMRPTSTATPPNTQTPTKTRVPPTRTPRPPTATASPFIYNAVLQRCQHSGGTFVEGTVNSLIGEVAGARVAFGVTPGSASQTIVTGNDKSPGHYTFVIRANGAQPGTYYVWMVDTAGNPLSDPSAGRVVTNAIKNGDDPGACWQAFVDFVAVR